MTIGVPQIAAMAVALAGCVTDLRSRKIPNVLTLGSAAAAFVYFLVMAGVRGLGWSAGGWGVGLLMFLPFFALRGIGGGDVKLMAALGSWMGPGVTVWIALYAMVAGGPLALIVAFGSGYVKQAFTNVWGLLMFWRVAGLRPHPALTLEAPGGAPRLPYALPIAAGLAVALWLR